MLTEKQLAKLKKQLLEQRAIHTKDASIQESLRDATDELSTVDNHPADLATELYEREKDMALTVHQKELLMQVQAALERIEEGTYGICLTCQQSIDYDRLRALPYTAFCIEHSKENTVATDRPIEEDIILPFEQSLANGQVSEDDALQIVAQYGSSDTPADFEGDDGHYVSNEQTEDMYAAIDILHTARESLNGQISKAYADEARKNDYLQH